MRIAVTFLLIFICNICAGQDSSSIYVHSWKNQKKVAAISRGEYLDLELDYSDSLKANKLAPTTFSGHFLFMKDSMLFLSMVQEEMTLKKPNGRKKESLIYYTFSDSLGTEVEGEIRKINIARITSISYSKQKPIGDIGVFIAGMSVLTALVIAPLVSVNFKNGDFRQDRYYDILAGCGAGLTIGLPLGFIFMKNKGYHLKNHPPAPDDMKDYYLSDK
jgi:hypothetical protein